MRHLSVDIKIFKGAEVLKDVTLVEESYTTASGPDISLPLALAIMVRLAAAPTPRAHRVSLR